MSRAASDAPGQRGAEATRSRRQLRPNARVLARYLRSRISSRGQRHLRAWTVSRGADRLLLAASLALSLLALAAGAGATLALAIATPLAIAALLIPRPRGTGETALSETGRLASAALRLERRIEQLQDLNWKIFENEARYRHLLDSQDDMILRRDGEGRLTYVNRAFCTLFGVAAADVLGKPFDCSVLARETVTPEKPGARRSRTLELLSTARGARWVEWEQHPVDSAGTFGEEIQCIGRDVTEARAAAAELAVARDQSEAASRAKSRFLAAMSHEIRTPMNGILGMAGLLSETRQTPEQATYTRAVEQSARNLLVIIDEILDFSKIEAGKIVLASEPFSIEHTVQAAVELLAPAAEEKGLEIAWTIGRGLPARVLGDEARVRQILLNLLSNAVKFTDTGGVVLRVACEHGSGALEGASWIRFEVEDTGIGLSDGDRETLFCEFEQADAAIRRQHGGTGLGLAISKRLAAEMQGDITVCSAPGKGSVFTVRLPLPVAGEEVTKAPATAAASEVRVLLALDRPIERRALAGLLEAYGIDAVSCEPCSATATLAGAAEQTRPVTHVLVGCELCPAEAASILSEARARRGRGEVRGLVLVNLLSRANLSAFQAHGFEAYLVRPVRPASLLERLIAPVPATEARGQPVETPQTPARKSSAPAGSPRILLAEDNDINALLATRMLEKSGCSVTAVRSGMEAVRKMESVIGGGEAPFGLILMDIFMPVLDGIEAMRHIRKLFAACSNGGMTCPPIVALTANAFAEDRARYLEAGMDDYLSKPFDAAQIRALLDRWLLPLPGRDGSPAPAAAGRPAA